MPILDPDIVVRPEELTEGSGERNAREPGSRAIGDRRSAGIAMTVNRVQIVNNRELGAIDVDLIGIVAAYGALEPLSITMRRFSGVNDNDDLDLGSDGLVILEEDRSNEGELPEHLAYRIIVAEAAATPRAPEAVLAQVMGDERTRGFRELLQHPSGGRSGAEIARSASDFLTDLVAKALLIGPEDQIIHVAGAFSAAADHGARYGVITHRNAFASVSYRVRTS